MSTSPERSDLLDGDSRIDALCDEFEHALNAGGSPRIEEFLSRVSADLRMSALQELLKVEIELRRDRGEQVGAQDYLARFSDSEAVVSAVCRQSDVALGTEAHDPNKYARREAGHADLAIDPLYGSDGDQATSDFTDRNSGVTIASPPADAARQTTEDNPNDTHRVTAAGERFQKLRSHAAGGLGEVSLARDQQLNRVVALKELQRKYADDPAVKARFLLEGEVTGYLEHPGIVPVYAMGYDEGGRPFYAMRFIRGDSLRQAIRDFHRQANDRNLFSRNSLPFRRLLNQFIAICNAVAFAHDRGVLHRDMKPENVMLGKFGETLVVDWGMARVVGRPEIEQNSGDSIACRLSPRHSSLTLEGSALGTPAYMSPEVAAGKTDQVGPACDVFSLGATLYCLLTNRPPLLADSIAELLRKAECCDYPPPCTINPRVPKALEAICCRAMALEPQSRYPTPLELAGDVERWLGDEAVSAYRERLPERLFRWARRHRSWAIALAASICVVTLVSLIATGLINESRRQAVALADANARLASSEKAARAEAVKRFAESRRTVDKWLTGFTDAIEYYPGVQSFRNRMLTQAAENYSLFAKQVSDDPDLELERARTLVRLGDLRHELLQTDAAKEAYTQALTVFTGLPLHGVSVATATLESANVKVRQGILASELGELGEAEKQYTIALKELQGIVGSDQDQERLTMSLVDAHSAYGTLLTSQGKLVEAELQLRRAIELQAGLVRSAPANLKLVDPLAEARIRLGQLLLQRGAAQQAVTEFGQVIVHWDHLVELEPDHPEPRQARASARINLASALRLLGHYSQEAQAYCAAITDYEALRAAMPDVPAYRENLSLTETDLGQLLFEIGHPQEAANILTKARSQLTELADTHRNVVRFREELAVCVDNLGQAQSDLGLLTEALASHEAAEKTLRSLARVARYTFLRGTQRHLPQPCGSDPSREGESEASH